VLDIEHIAEPGLARRLTRPRDGPAANERID